MALKIIEKLNLQKKLRTPVKSYCINYDTVVLFI